METQELLNSTKIFLKVLLLYVFSNGTNVIFIGDPYSHVSFSNGEFSGHVVNLRIRNLSEV